MAGHFHNCSMAGIQCLELPEALLTEALGEKDSALSALEMKLRRFDAPLYDYL